jgi:hypothetical protein
MDKVVDVIAAAKDFLDATRVWARSYAVRYRAALSKPSADDARDDLRRWASAYAMQNPAENPPVEDDIIPLTTAPEPPAAPRSPPLRTSSGARCE